MENWEFLIQKQGDGEWLPLQSPDVEILEGRYRVLARSNRQNVTVSVRVIYTTPEDPSLRRVQTRSRQTNPNGLMVVFPFVYLKPGYWEIRCESDLLSEMGLPWQRSVHLQVLPKEADVYEDEQPITPVISAEEPEIPTENTESQLTRLLPTPEIPTENTESQLTQLSLPTPEIPTENIEAYLTGLLLEIEIKTEPEPPPLNEADFEVNLTEPLNQPLWLQGQTAEQILQSLIDSALPPEDNLAELEVPEVVPLSPVLSLSLDRETYFAHSRTPLTISGRIDLLENSEYSHTVTPPTLSNAELRIELREPSMGRLLTQGWQTLTAQSLPLTFNSVVEMPADCNSMLILAEISLYGVSPWDALNHEVRLLASQSFTITADVAELLELVAVQAIEVPTPQAPLPVQVREEESINLALFNIVKTSTPINIRFESVNKSPLPPLIKPSDGTTTLRLPQLPSLPQPQRQPVVNDVFNATESNTIVVASDPLDLILPGTLPPADSPVANTTVPNVTSGEDVAFQSLGEQQRFWTQVNNYLTTDEELSITPETKAFTYEEFSTTPQTSSELMSVEQYLQIDKSPPPLDRHHHPAAPIPDIPNSSIISDIPIPSTIPDTSTPSTAVALYKSDSSAIALDWLAQEIVVEDILPENPSRFYKRHHPEQSIEDAPLETVAQEEPIPPPTPELDVPLGELIAGDLLIVHLHLPTERPQMAIKLWIADYQTRALLDGPHWVKDLIPNDLGGMDARKQLIVPYGCLEMRLEAIALDLATQEESHKVTIERTIIPANVANFQDELLGII